jgi:hypothetical protein
MLQRNWRHFYSDHPEDFDFNGNPLPAPILEERRSEELLTQLIQVARIFPGQFRRLLVHVLNTEMNRGKNRS